MSIAESLQLLPTAWQKALRGLPIGVNRTCESCAACCWAFAVPELNKPEQRLCRFATGPQRAPCSIYAQRPRDCARYLCLWRAGLGGPRERPNRSGWIVDVTHTGRSPVLTVRVTQLPGAPHDLSARLRTELRGLWQRGLILAFVPYTLTGPFWTFNPHSPTADVAAQDACASDDLPFLDLDLAFAAVTAAAHAPTPHHKED